MSYAYAGNKYVDENGRVYKVNGLINNGDLVFSTNSNGELLYKSKSTDDIVLTIRPDGYLYINGDYNISITSDGYITSTAGWSIVLDVDAQGDPVTAEMQKNIDLLRSHNKNIKMRATLLGENYEPVVGQSIVGRIKAITFNRTSDSLIRSTCSLTMSIPKKEQIALNIEETWNKRMVQLDCGILDRTSNAIGDNRYVWYKLGRMLLLNGRTKYDATTQEVQLNLADLMASLAQERGNQIGADMVIRAGANTRAAIEKIIADYAPYKLHKVCNFHDTIPYDLTIDIGSYPIDMLQTILDVFPTYEMFYDADGWFNVQPIPTKIADPVDIGKDILDDMLISESKSVDFSNIKNTTEIWGRELTADYAAGECVTVEETIEEDGEETIYYSYHVTIDPETFTELVSGETYMVIPDADNHDEQKMKIQELPEYGIFIEKMGTITNDQGVEEIALVYIPISAGEMKANTPYVIKYFEQKFILQGEFQIRCIVQEIAVESVEDIPQAGKDHYMADNDCQNVKWIPNPDNPYACTVSESTGWIQGEMRQVLIDGEYSNIYTTELAYERAEYENWMRCRMQDTVEIECILIPWMEINDKIEYTSPVNEQIVTWLVQDIDYDFSNWTMTVKASRFYPYYPWD